MFHDVPCITDIERSGKIHVYHTFFFPELALDVLGAFFESTEGIKHVGPWQDGKFPKITLKKDIELTGSKLEPHEDMLVSRTNATNA